MSADPQRNMFYEHYRQDKPTKLGKWLGAGVDRQIFEFAQIQKGTSVLEIGPGRSTFADICLDAGAEYSAIEANAEMAAAIRKRGAMVITAKVPPIPDMHRCFDVVVMNSVMEHMDTMTAALQLSEQVRAILKPGGRFVVYAPDYPNWQYHFYVGDFSHNYITSWRRLEGLLMSAGFTNMRCRYQSNVITGLPGFIVSVLASWLPFCVLDIMFPKNWFLHKLAKLQITFLRRVLIAGTG